MSKRAVFAGMMMMLVGAVAPAYAQDAQMVAAGGGMSWQVASIFTGGFALAIAAGLAALGQGRAIASATEAIARNPSAAGEIRGALILGLVLIESLAIYVLLISLILFFLTPFAPAA